MLESLAPSRWDIFEDDIVAAVRQMRDELSDGEALTPAASEYASPPAAERDEPETVAEESAAVASETQQIEVAGEADATADVDVAVTVVEPAAKPKKRARRASRKQAKKPAPQLGKRAVRIDIVDETTEGKAPKQSSDADDPPAQAAAFKIPLDPD